MTRDTLIGNHFRHYTNRQTLNPSTTASTREQILYLKKTQELGDPQFNYLMENYEIEKTLLLQ